MGCYSRLRCLGGLERCTLPLAGKESRPSAKIEAERKGVGLWVYQIVETDGVDERLPVRELTWFFAEEEGWEIGVGAYVARETEGDGRDEFEVEFGEGMVLDVLEEGEK